MVRRRWHRCWSAHSCGVAVASIFPLHRHSAPALADFDFPHGHCWSRARVRVIPSGCRNGAGECSRLRNRIQFHLVHRLGPARLACIVARWHNNLTSAAAPPVRLRNQIPEDFADVTNWERIMAFVVDEVGLTVG